MLLTKMFMFAAKVINQMQTIWRGFITGNEACIKNQCLKKIFGKTLQK